MNIGECAKKIKAHRNMRCTFIEGKTILSIYRQKVKKNPAYYEMKLSCLFNSLLPSKSSDQRCHRLTVHEPSAI